MAKGKTLSYLFWTWQEDRQTTPMTTKTWKHKATQENSSHKDLLYAFLIYPRPTLTSLNRWIWRLVLHPNNGLMDFTRRRIGRIVQEKRNLPFIDQWTKDVTFAHPVFTCLLLPSQVNFRDSVRSWSETKAMEIVCDLDLETNTYLSKPSSSWTLAGITNIEVWVYERDREIDRSKRKCALPTRRWTSWCHPLETREKYELKRNRDWVFFYAKRKVHPDGISTTHLDI